MKDGETPHIHKYGKSERLELCRQLYLTRLPVRDLVLGRLIFVEQRVHYLSCFIDFSSLLYRIIEALPVL
jgi:hypothetical protein